jgi:hypothetical protein
MQEWELLLTENEQKCSRDFQNTWETEREDTADGAKGQSAGDASGK